MVCYRHPKVFVVDFALRQTPGTVRDRVQAWVSPCLLVTLVLARCLSQEPCPSRGGTILERSASDKPFFPTGRRKDFDLERGLAMRRPTRLFRTLHLSKLLVVVLSLPLLTVALSCTVSQEEAEQADTEISDAPIDVRVTAYRLSEDYKSNELAANQKYDDKVLAVTGTIEEISGGVMMGPRYT